MIFSRHRIRGYMKNLHFGKRYLLELMTRKSIEYQQVNIITMKFVKGDRMHLAQKI